MSTSRPKFLVLAEPELARDEWDALCAIAEPIWPKATNRTELLAELQSGSLDGVVAAYRAFRSTPLTGPMNAEFIAAVPSSLKFICSEGAGYDAIDISACTARGISVSNTPTAVDDATADTAIFLLLGALRNFNASIVSLRKGDWSKGVSRGHDPQGKVLGILGMGGIGRNMAIKARAFGMTIRYYNRTQLSPEEEAGAEYVSFETLLKESDVISLNLPLNAKTRHIISTREFALMKPGVVIVNTARGAVIDEAALVEALDSGHVASAGLDVFEDEPRIHPGLLANQNVLLLPHMGTATQETDKKMENWTLDNLKLALTEGRLKTIVPDQRGVMP